jgi:hypothetical protein
VLSEAKSVSVSQSGPAFFEDNEDALKGIIDDVKACATPRTRRELCKVVDSFEEVENVSCRSL